MLTMLILHSNINMERQYNIFFNLFHFVPHKSWLGKVQEVFGTLQDYICVSAIYSTYRSLPSMCATDPGERV